jgi:hypothetical protein
MKVMLTGKEQQQFHYSFYLPSLSGRPLIKLQSDIISSVCTLLHAAELFRLQSATHVIE